MDLLILPLVVLEMVDMEPVIAPFVAKVSFALGDLIGVVREGVVDATRMDIQSVSPNTGAMQEHSICQPG